MLRTTKEMRRGSANAASNIKWCPLRATLGKSIKQHFIKSRSKDIALSYTLNSIHRFVHERVLRTHWFSLYGEMLPLSHWLFWWGISILTSKDNSPLRKSLYPLMLQPKIREKTWNMRNEKLNEYNSSEKFAMQRI